LQPDIFAPYLFIFANRPDLTQEYVRWNMDNKYTTEPDGLPGNDDYGTFTFYLFNFLIFIFPFLNIYASTINLVLEKYGNIQGSKIC
jgi:putative alpha-1,2-mannosidase